MKAIIDLAKRGSVFETAAAQYSAARKGKSSDYRLHFESARALFAELTPARIELLETLRGIGPCSVYALAKASQRNYSNVHADVAALECLGLAQRDGDEADDRDEAVDVSVGAGVAGRHRYRKQRRRHTAHGTRHSTRQTRESLLMQRQRHSQQEPG